jgi:DNA-binding response OmpR family regulator
MNKVLIVSQRHDKAKVINQELSKHGFSCQVSQNTGNLVDQSLGQKPDVLLLDNYANAFTNELNLLQIQLAQITGARSIPILILADAGIIPLLENLKDLDDFVIDPYSPPELLIRLRRSLNRKNRKNPDEVLRHDDLIINMANCEVLLCGKLITLTFKEYELLKFLALNKGRVFSRESLLNEIWGFDYYGGDRTVDVHIRRLRSKIEDSTHSYVDTVRNIGYKFKENAKITAL